MKQFIICPECGMPILAKIVKGVISKFEYHFKCEYCECEGFDYEVEIMKAISIRQPWAYLVIKGIKPIENRTWKLPEKYKEKRVLVHTGMQYDNRQILDLFTTDQWYSLFPSDKSEYILERKWQTSAIIGSVEIVDCVINHPSIWAEKTDIISDPDCGLPIYGDKIYNWVLKDPILFSKHILNVKGKLSFFTPEIPD